MLNTDTLLERSWSSWADQWTLVELVITRSHFYWEKLVLIGKMDMNSKTLLEENNAKFYWAKMVTYELSLTTEKCSVWLKSQDMHIWSHYWFDRIRTYPTFLAWAFFVLESFMEHRGFAMFTEELIDVSMLRLSLLFAVEPTVTTIWRAYFKQWIPL